MKVLMINTVCGAGSTGRICTELADSLDPQLHQVKIAYRGSQNLPEGYGHYGYRIGTKADVYAHALLTRITDKCGFYSKSATKKLVAFIREFQPDVIHLHNLHGYYVNIGILFDYLKTEFTGKVIWTLHDCWAFTGHCTHYTAAGCYKWQTGDCRNCPEKRLYPTSMVLDRSRKNFLDKKRIFTGVPNMTIITVSNWLKQQAERSFLGCYPVECIYNGIDYDRFTPTDSNVRQELGIQGKKMILCVSDGWNERKGLGRITNLAAIAPDDWRFVIVGMNKDQIADLPENCIGMERTRNQQELVKLYSAADVFYNPSVEETFGLVTAEAIACGTPAVVMNSTACPEPLSGYGTVLDSLEPEKALQAIKTLLEHTPQHPGRTFPKENMISGYLAHYFK